MRKCWDWIACMECCDICVVLIFSFLLLGKETEEQNSDFKQQPHGKCQQDL